MSTQNSELDFTVSPLGNGFYQNRGESMTNTFGETHPVINDVWGTWHIVAPEASLDLYLPEPSVVYVPVVPVVPVTPVVPVVPNIPVPNIPPPVTCVIGCSPVIPEIPDHPVPEPSAFHMFLFGAYMIGGVVAYRHKWLTPYLAVLVSIVACIILWEVGASWHEN